MTDWDNLEGEARCPRHRQGVGGAVVSPGDKLWSLRDVDPNWDGGCLCADGLVLGFHVEVDCWRTGPQKGGCAIHVWKQATIADVPHGLHYLRPIDIAAHVHAALVTGWPGDVWIFLEDEPPLLWGCE